MARRTALLLGVLAVVLAIRGTILVARVLVANVGYVDRLLLWAILPMSLSAWVLVQIGRRGAMWTVWVAVGAQWGFVIAALWSLGSFYALSALAALVAATSYLVSLRAWTHAGLAVLWLLTGLTGLGPIFLTLDWIRSLTPGVTVGHAEAVVVASWIFLGLAGLLVAIRLLSSTIRS